MEQFPFQVDGTTWLRSLDRALLADDLGLGKTNQLLMAAESPTLIVAPAMLLGVWQEEWQRWRPDLDATLVAYTSVCVRGENNRTLPRPKREYLRPWATVICDEAHALKSRGTTAAHLAKAVELVWWRSGRGYLSTGTPVPNWGHELYQLIRLLHERHDPRWSNYWAWIDVWFGTYRTRFSRYNIGPLRDKYTWDDFIEGNDLGRLLLRRERDDVLPELPPLTEQVIEVPMTEAQARAYRSMKKDYIADLPDGDELVAWTDGARSTALLQMSTGLEVMSPKVKASGKMLALRELLAGRTSPTMVAVFFRNSAFAVERLCNELGLSCAVVVGGDPKGSFRLAQRFQAGEFDVLAATIDTVAEGLTLTRADQVILVERHPVPHKNEQVIRRLHRIGQTRPVSAIHLRTPGTVDMGQWRLLGRKGAEIAAVLEAAARA